MAITKSTYSLGHPQRDGRVYITERHEADTEDVFTVEYLGDAKDDVEGVMATRALQIDTAEMQRSADETARGVLESAESKSLQHVKKQPDSDLKLFLTVAEISVLKDG